MAVYQGLRVDGTYSIMVRRLEMKVIEGGPRIVSEFADGVNPRPELVTDLPGDLGEIAASLLANCMGDTLARELGSLFALNVIRPLVRDDVWMINEFQIREWCAENKVPY